MRRGWIGGITDSPEDSMKLGREMAGFIELGDVISLSGELAAGKTTFTKGLAQGLGYEGPVTSPTFTLVNEYEGDIHIIHMDCYRESDLDRWLKLGISEYFNGINVVLIEWADRISPLLPDDLITLDFEHAGESMRRIILR